MFTRSQVVYFFARNKVIILLIGLVILIVFLTSFIFYLNSPKNQSTISSSQIQAANVLKQKVDSILSADSKASGLNEGTRLDQKFNIVEDTSTSEKEKFDALAIIADFSQSLYSSTNNPKLYSYINTDLINYAKKYFPKFYNNSNFVYPCQDTSCEDSPQPKEILKIIDEINASDFPDQVKKDLSRDLINTGYRSQKEEIGKFNQYLIIASNIKNNSWFSKTGETLKIAQDLENFIKETYPREYKNLK